MGALGTRHSLRPLLSRGERFLQNLGRLAPRDRVLMFEIRKPSLRAKRSNPSRRAKGRMDCFVASLLAMTVSELAVLKSNQSDATIMSTIKTETGKSGQNRFKK
jgi:hypothetical protein